MKRTAIFLLAATLVLALAAGGAFAKSDHSGKGSANKGKSGVSKGKGSANKGKGKGPSFVVYNFAGTIDSVDADDTGEVTSITVNVTEANKAARPYANPLPQEKVFQVGENTKVELDEQDADSSALQAGQEVEIQFKGAANTDPTNTAATAISARSVEEESEPTG